MNSYLIITITAMLCGSTGLIIGCVLASGKSQDLRDTNDHLKLKIRNRDNQIHALKAERNALRRQLNIAATP